MKLSVVTTFTTKFSVPIPKEGEADVFRNYEFTATFKCLPQNVDAAQKQNELTSEGIYVFLGEILVSVTGPSDFEITGEDGEALPLLEGFKQHQLLSGYAVGAYWEVVNKGLRGKNSKR